MPGDDGIYLYFSNSNGISANTVTNNGVDGIWIGYSSNNGIYANTIANNANSGIYLGVSSDNIISANRIAYNLVGVSTDSYSQDFIFHNNFIDNTYQAGALTGSLTVWDDGYPSGGNYWSNYNGVALYKGVNQIDPGTDGIGDTPYVINAGSQIKDRYPLLNPWSPTFTLENIAAWYWTGSTVVNSVGVGDVDGDGQKEIVTGGTFFDGARNVAQLVVWGSSSLSVKRLTTWYWTGNTNILSVAIGDVDGDAQVEIVTGGYYNDGIRNVAQLVVWNGATLAVDRLTTWYWTGNTEILSVAIGDVDADGQTEIVTGGIYNDAQRNVAQLVVWNGASLAADRIAPWYTTSHTTINSVALGDMDGDCEVEVATGGYYNDGSRNLAQMSVRSGSSLETESIHAWYWTGNTLINSVSLSDINGDFTAEVITGGAYYESGHWNAQLTVWGMRQTV